MAARYDRITQNRFSRLRTDLPDKTRNFQENTIQSGWLLQGSNVTIKWIKFFDHYDCNLPIIVAQLIYECNKRNLLFCNLYIV